VLVDLVSGAPGAVTKDGHRMAKSKRAKPSLDRTPKAARPDAEVRAHPVETAAEVIDVAPVSALSVPMRAMSPLERGIELTSRPFGVVVMLGMAALGAFRSRRTFVLLLACGALMSVSCRSREIWAGQEFLAGRLRLAAQEPYCGCMTIRSQHDQQLTLTSYFHGMQLGETKLNKGDVLAFRYDWAGPENDDVYEIEAKDGNQKLNLQDQKVITIEDGACGTRSRAAGAQTPPNAAPRCYWWPCDSEKLTKCPYGDLVLDLGGIGKPPSSSLPAQPDGR
jgi:hypothetical protein